MLPFSTSGGMSSVQTCGFKYGAECEGSDEYRINKEVPIVPEFAELHWEVVLPLNRLISLINKKRGATILSHAAYCTPKMKVDAIS